MVDVVAGPERHFAIGTLELLRYRQRFYLVAGMDASIFALLRSARVGISTKLFMIINLPVPKNGSAVNFIFRPVGGNSL